MSPRLFTLSVLALLPCLGCGTIANVTAPNVESSGYRAFGPTGCEPFGGVQRSVLGGSALAMAGPLGIAAAVVAVGVDTPLSLVGDIATLPVVVVRRRLGDREPSVSDPAPTALPLPTVSPTDFTGAEKGR